MMICRFEFLMFSAYLICESSNLVSIKNSESFRQVHRLREMKSIEVCFFFPSK